jgi:hypothetical protein
MASNRANLYTSERDENAHAAEQRINLRRDKLRSGQIIAHNNSGTSRALFAFFSFVLCS